MSETRFFRACILGAVLLAVISPIVDLLAPSLVFALARHVDERPEGWTPIVQVASWLSLAAASIGVIAAVGMLSWKKWARPVGLWAVSYTHLTLPTILRV